MLLPAWGLGLAGPHGAIGSVDLMHRNRPKPDRTPSGRRAPGLGWLAGAAAMVPPPVDQDSGGGGGGGVSWLVVVLIVILIGAFFYWLLIRRK